MALTVRGQVGPQVLADGTEQPLRLGKTGELLVSERLGRHAEEAYRGNLFNAGAAANVPASGAAAGPVLYNPAGSGRLLVVEKVRLALTATTSAAGTVFYAYQKNLAADPTSTTAMPTVPGLVGSGSKPVGQAFTVATLTVAATELMPFGQKSATLGSGLPIVDDLAGCIILGQGTLLTLYTSNADTTPAHHAGFTWVEIPV